MGEEHPVVGSLAPGATVEYYEERDEWLRVHHDGVDGWIEGESLRKVR